MPLNSDQTRTAIIDTLHEQHRIRSAHRCSCGWEGDSATTHIIDSLGIEPVATGKFGLWEWPDGATGWGDDLWDINYDGSKQRVPVYRLKGLENGSFREPGR